MTVFDLRQLLLQFDDDLEVKLQDWSERYDFPAPLESIIVDTDNSGVKYLLLDIER